MDIFHKRVLPDRTWHGFCIIYPHYIGTRGKPLDFH